MRGSGVKPARLDDTAIDPVVNHVGADSEMLSHLLNSQFLRPYERGPGNLVAVTNPLVHRTREGFAQGADLAFWIEAIGDISVGQALGEMPNAVHNRSGIPHAVSYIGGELHANVSGRKGRPRLDRFHPRPGSGADVIRRSCGAWSRGRPQPT